MKIVEVTGMPASGKSWFIDDQIRAGGNSTYGFDAGVLRSRDRRLNRKWWSEIVMWTILASSAHVTREELYWIARQTRVSNQPWLHRLNMARNCLLKLAYRSYLERIPELQGSAVYVDEGLSHIPMIVQRLGEAGSIVREFDQLFGRRLLDTTVLCIEHAGGDHAARLANRGHTRIDTGDPAAVDQLLVASAETTRELKAMESPWWSVEIIAPR